MMRNFMFLLLVAFALGPFMVGCGKEEKTETEKLEEAVTRYEMNVTFNEAVDNLENLKALANRLEKWSELEVFILYPPKSVITTKREGVEELRIALSNP
jgi:K+-sensing histidine kinase KdpD